MAHFNPGPGDDSIPFGKNEYRRSTVGLKYDTVQIFKDAVPEEPGQPGEKILQSGEVLAKITSGPGKDMWGPYQIDATDGRGDLANVDGVNDTFDAFKLRERNIEAASCYSGTLDQQKCFIRDATGARIELTDAVAEALVAKKHIEITFR
ncbi:capsid decoration protein [Rhodococcus phage Reynauld]|uniref:Capsid decoration protein n=1 Tax=Rhodococcus phage Reynauld TaxID=3062845 RepID=A0ACD4UJG3_9CAUD|nr:capsid decoration protein [Rhodococcus phage Reynauld]